jgi:hypothetical protein
MTKRQDRDAIYAKRQFDTEIIVLCVRWYITYRLSYRDLVAMMAERGVIVSHRTIMRWVIRFVPVLRSVTLGGDDHSPRHTKSLPDFCRSQLCTVVHGHALCNGRGRKKTTKIQEPGRRNTWLRTRSSSGTTLLWGDGLAGVRL